jgi:hypothetical protein
MTPQQMLPHQQHPMTTPILGTTLTTARSPKPIGTLPLNMVSVRPRHTFQMMANAIAAFEATGYAMLP